MFKFINLKNRITLGLVCMMVSAMSLMAVARIGPDSRTTLAHGRAHLCESIAFSTSALLNEQDLDRMESVLSALVQRNEDVLSAGLRRKSGEFVAEVGEHFENWQSSVEYSTETHVEVPLSSGKTPWGTVEIRFEPAQTAGLKGLWKSSLFYLAVLATCCFFAFSFYLGRVLQQLDPSKAVPKRVRTALDSLAEGLIVTDVRGQVALANEAFAKWAGKDSEKLIGHAAERFPWTKVAEASDGIQLDPPDDDFPWARALRTELPEAGYLLKLTNCDGQQLTLVANSSPILGAEGKVRGVLTSFEDVTDLERHKVELLDAKHEADRANREKSEFLARMSHEIRTPMNAILGYTEVLQFGMEEDEAKRQQHLATIQGSGEHLLALINDILDLSKIESGQMELELRDVSVHELIAQVVSVLKMRANEKGIRLEYLAEGMLPESIKTDGVRLKQAIINLVGNAIKFTTEGGVLIKPRVEPQQEGGSKLTIHIADTGIGMTAEAAEKVFEPFAQADTSITRRFGGTGLGLSISRELAEKLGGGISVVSEPGKGSIFSLSIDAGDLSETRMLSQDQLSLNMSIKATAEELLLPEANILIVDDSQANRDLVALFLKRAGVDYGMAVNGEDAVQQINTGQFDAVLMDMHMPIMDGFQATRVLREQGQTLPIIALTADAMAQDERKCRDHGCSHFLAKPIKRERLYKTLQEALGGQPGLRRLPRKIDDSKLLSDLAPVDTVIETKKLLVSSGVDVVETVALGEEDQSPKTVSPTKLDRAATSKVPSEPARPQSATVPLAAPSNDAVSEVIGHADFIESNLPMDDIDFVNIANLFVDQLRQKIQLMDENAEHENFEEIYELGHWLKGSGGSAGFDHFNVPGKQLETYAKEGDLEKTLQEIESIKAIANRIRVVDLSTADSS